MFNFDIFGSILFDKPADGGAGGGDNGATVKGSKDLEPQEEFRQLASNIKDLVNGNASETKEAKQRLEQINDRLDQLELDYQAHKNSVIKRPTNEKRFEHLDTFKTAFHKFASGDRGSFRHSEDGGLDIKSGYHPVLERKDNTIVRFDLSSGGALLLPAELSSTILHNVQEATPVARLVRSTMTDRPEKKRTLRTGTPGIQWLEEAGTTDKKKTTYKVITITPHKAAARYAYSVEEQEDSAFDLVGELQQAYQEDFEIGVGSAVVGGDGVGKPNGMLGNIDSYESDGLSITGEMLIQVQESRKDSYQDNGAWLFNRQTRAAIRTVVLSEDNALQYLWEPDFTRRAPTLLLGNPIYIARAEDLAGSSDNSYSAGDAPLIYGDFERGYEMVMRTDMYIIDDPYSEADSFITNLHIMSRVGGQPLQKEALVELEITS